ncbi:MAG: hypothetical protein GW946_00695 [Candidatus Pacebacteria bacterium]|nr:hypothetical protein [Candidatus Paceibacterota bacterium]PIR60868.1 MAG: hypothetical protein COU67_00220 [Candidatus Pacebacteria bacterium CG10_big_fil_rev_8_21_14_0_10_44_54]
MSQLAANNLGIGKIAQPPGVDKYQAAAGSEIGIMLFISMLVKFAMIVAGIWAMLNIFLAAYIYINGKGDPGNHEKVAKVVTNTTMGLVLLISLYTIVAIIGLVFFGDANYILRPTLAPVPGL